MVERIILHLDMDAFFASVEQRDHPELRGRPVFVCGNRHSRTVVATASYEARAFGVTTGMPLHEARELCPSAILVEGSPGKYAACFREVTRMMERYSPLLEVCSIDEAFLDLTPTAERFGGSVAVAHALWREVQATLALPCSIGLGPNKLIAKLASSRKKPNGIVEIRAADVSKILETLRVEALCGIGPAFQDVLNSQGITTCGQLAQVSLARLIAQCGLYTGTHLYRLARGIDDTPVVTTDQTPLAKSMGHLHTLAHDTTEPGVMRAVLLELSEKVGRRLRAEGAAGRTVTVTMRYRDFATFSRARTLDRFFDDGYDIYQVGWQILECARLLQGIRMLGICVSGLSYGIRQAWWLPQVIRQRRLLGACDRINDRFGEATVRRATLLGEPEAARHYQLKRYSARTLIATR